jgi:hypothetical protein
VSSTSGPDVIQFRHHASRAVAALVVAISTVTLAAVSPYLGALALVPLGYAAWLWRAGTDVGPAGLRVRALLGQRLIPWSAVTAVIPDRRGRVRAGLAGGASVPLTAVTAADLPRLAEAGARAGQEQPRD